ncbi:hypothetical protein LDL08_13120 [Nonomuraea glycinis]|uniref:Uncharacterized protein n=1 Tax=Nonomuraea glycinis TaxID=2047744 RepID=A0A918A3P1_9ACTN|nr:hypothetical protein [Nonomuraea glycinis]MCA2177123.1 hypothetical protein [Nonomuraea glycinis]GGP02634.1 hypothetical protein GCM10012278_10550 [Nonomuraea glycinis]
MTADPVVMWEPYQPGYGRLRVTETSCCGAFEWVCQGGLFVILRSMGNGDEETGRGVYSETRAVWDKLVFAHHSENHAPRDAPRTWRGVRTDSLP